MKHKFEEMSGDDYGLSECENCYLIVESRCKVDHAKEKCPEDKP